MIPVNRNHTGKQGLCVLVCVPLAAKPAACVPPAATEETFAVQVPRVAGHLHSKQLFSFRGKKRVDAIVDAEWGKFFQSY